ncbi:H(+)/Cl(-) exchange transporter 3 [Tolypocladium paradoxum]|uniref:H(+)/Cl(-) exchange transporter 3 n=1 Tax=Tolypocladium paradoxum TaxID=94208 RepID=A0A2S4KPN9_9HYPO|nr:H(+)/Cl(-) exchange transporter 3 [Tolypocladium paradoxum]
MADREGGNPISQPPSPRTTRQPVSMNRLHSGSEPDERSPLLAYSRSRVRIQSGTNSPRIPQLSRNQSYTGKLRPSFLHPSHRPSLTKGSLQAASAVRDITAGTGHGVSD